MSDPTPAEIATLPETLRQRARDRTLTSWLRLELEQTATALASLQRRAETAERERDEARGGSAAPYCWTKQQLYTWWKVQLERANVAESSLADQAKVIEAARIVTEACWQIGAGDYGHMAVHPKDMRDFADALSQLAEKGGDKR